MHSSSTRRKAAFVPWLAALVLGASAHAGWLIHELVEHETEKTEPRTIIVEVDAGSSGEAASRRSRERSEARARARARATVATPRCRHAQLEPPEAIDDLDLWIHQRERYVYTIDRRALEHVAFAEYDFADLERLGAIVERLGFVEPIELRNIRQGTPLYMLGLRNGDRLVAISTRGEPELEQVAVAIERRGRRLAMIYEIV
jgi:hypothetical protein